MFFWFTNRSHRAYRELLSARLDGQLGPEGQARLDSHLAACSECRRVASELNTTVALLRAVPMVDTPRSFALSHVPLPEPRPSRLWGFASLRSMQMATAVSALALMALVVIDLVQPLGDEVIVTGQPAVLEREAASAAEEEVSLAAGAPEPALAAEEGPTLAMTIEADAAEELAEQPEPIAEREVAALAGPIATVAPASPAAGRDARQWLLLAVALVTAALALGATVWTWRLRPPSPR